MPTFGETRADGKRFRGYQTARGKVYEQWLSPEAWEARRERQTKWRRDDYEKNPEKHRAKGRHWMQVYRDRDPIRFMLTAARSRAKAAGLAFEIDRTHVPVPEFCPVFGVPLHWSVGAPDDCSPSIDRIDNSRGYVPGNVLVVSHRANQLKRDATLAELLTLAHFYGAIE